jgi:glutathione S-transferase
LQALGSRFSPSPYVFGEFSAADIYLFHCLNLASTLMQASYGWDILAEVDGMSEWFELVKSREVTQSVLADQAEAMQAMMARRG